MPSTEEIRKIIFQELPKVLENDIEVQNFILQLSRQYFADKNRTEDRIERILDELKLERERQDRKWEQQDKKWEEQSSRWEYQDKVLEEQSRRWEQQDKKWEEESRRWEQENRKWEENQKVINEMLQDIKALSRKHDSTIGALGARWGLHTEQAFRNALKGILEEFPGVQVFNVTEYDESGQVFGHPDQVELDLIVKDGTTIIAEIKSSVSKAEMYVLERKVSFYEQLHNCQVDRTIIISPMLESRAWPVARKLGIEVYNAAEDVSL